MNDELWYSDGLAFECQQCGGCCGGFPGFVWVSEEEAEKIAEHLGMSIEDFYAEKTRRVMGKYTFKEVGNYDCIMLENGGCSIYELRPIQCRTFPFWEENLESREDWDAAARHCPGMNKGKTHDVEHIEKERLSRE